MMLFILFAVIAGLCGLMELLEMFTSTTASEKWRNFGRALGFWTISGGFVLLASYGSIWLVAAISIIVGIGLLFTLREKEDGGAFL